MEPFEPGARVERCNSPLDSLVKDGLQGTVIGDGLQAENGTMGYFVKFTEAGVPVFCAASRLRSVTGA